MLVINYTDMESQLLSILFWMKGLPSHVPSPKSFFLYCFHEASLNSTRFLNMIQISKYTDG